MTARRDEDRDLVWMLTPAARPNPGMVVAAARAGALGILDLTTDRDRSRAALAETARSIDGTFGVRVSSPVTTEELPGSVDTVLLPVDFLDESWTRWARRGAGGVRRVVAEVTSVDQVAPALELDVDGLVAKGTESAGRVGGTGAFVLLQQVVAAVERRHRPVPVWVLGGIGVHTAGAAIVGGARGVVIDSQLALMDESDLPEEIRTAVAAMDGSEARVVAGHRVFHRPDLWTATSSAASVAPGEMSARLQGDSFEGEVAVPLGQDGCFASMFRRRWTTVGRTARGLRAEMDSHLAAAARQPALSGPSPFGTALPLAQGPMTRVSDQPAFASAVAEGGAMPFLALALLDGAEVASLLEQTRQRVGERPWGVGILGFAPKDLRAEQLDAVREANPDAVIIAGGRPSQAARLEADGIATYLHVPGPTLLERFVHDGARRFVFEGFECGGHIGPRSSFVLWESQTEVLLQQGRLDGFHLLFAGGVHDARSAAIMSTIVSPLVERGATVGAVMGTAYLFTAEAVETAAIGSAFQEEALACRRTATLESGPGHITRCAESGFVDRFELERSQLVEEGRSHEEIWAHLEALNLGRLRLASKGLRRDGDELVGANDAEQRSEGLFMIGDAATLRDRVVSIADLHRDVVQGSADRVRQVAGERCGDAASSSGPGPLDVAIVGMAAVMPRAEDLETFWSNVIDGIDCVSEVLPERWNAAQSYNAEYRHDSAARDPKVESASKWGGFIPAVDFDALAYGIPPRSLAAVEPAQLLALKVATDALTDAGYDVLDPMSDLPRDQTAVIFAAGGGTDLAISYSLRSALPPLAGPIPPALDEYLPVVTEDSFPGMLTSVIAGRVANRLDLGGKNLTVDAACASSLAAVDVACAELVSGAADVAVCGSADLHNGLHDYQFFTSVHALSPTGRCRPFDRSADGIALGEGVACLVLKRWDDARRDGDRVYAVIRSVRGASDGRHLGLTAPRQEGQERALRHAYRSARVDPATVGLVEAHGTGTVVGDRTELQALNNVFGGAPRGAITLGSVKSNIGHTKCSAGLAGIIKAAKSIYHGVRPPTIHLDEPNPAFDGDDGPFHLLDRPRPWLDRERAAGVSAFGFGGTNFHLVLTGDAEAPADRPRCHWPSELVSFSGDEESVDRQLRNLLERISGRGDVAGIRLRDVAAATAGPGDDVRLAIVADDLDDLRRKAEDAAAGRSGPGIHRAAAHGPGPGAGDVAFLYPGQGSQRVGMVADLAVALPRLRPILEAGASWLSTMMPAAAFGADSKRRQKQALTDTRVAQPALGIAELCLVEALATVGLVPDRSAGHSFGELVALCSAGAFGVDDLFRLASVRAEAILGAAGEETGSMIAVAAGRDDVADIAARTGVVIANDNHPRQVVLSGPTERVEQAVEHCKSRGLATTRLNVACAFHSPVVAAAADTFRAALDPIVWHPTTHPVHANVTADPYPAAEHDAKDLLARQIADGVRFADEIRQLHGAGVRTFVEVGPGQALTAMVGEILDDAPHLAVSTDRANAHGITALLDALAELAVAGVPLDLGGLHQDRDSDPARWTEAIDPPAWTVNGHLIRQRADGRVVPGSLQPADETPVLHWTEDPVRGSGEGADRPDATNEREVVHMTEAMDGAEEVVVRFLDTLDRLGAAGEGVVRSYLGTDLASTRPDRDRAAPLPPAPVEAVDGGGATTEVTNRTDGGPVAGETPGSDPQPVAPLPDIIRQPEVLLGRLTEIVAVRTGYPPDLLDADMDLEADLSIDSIKRLEVLGELADQIGIDEGDLEAMDDLMEDLAAQKTLRSIVAFLVSQADRLRPIDGSAPPASEEPVFDPGDEAIGDPVASDPDVCENERPPGDRSSTRASTGSTSAANSGVGGRGTADQIPARALSYGVGLVDAGPPSRRSLDGVGIVVSGLGDVADALAAALAGEGGVVRRRDGDGRDDDPTDHVVVLCDLLGPAPPSIVELFETLRAVRRRGPREVVVVSGFGGGLGIDPPAPVSAEDPVPTGAGIRAMIKTFALEFPEVVFRLVDVSPSAPADELVAQVVDEITVADGPVEVGRVGERRRVQSVHVLPERRAVPVDLTSLGLDRDSVVLLTGGARGVTASLTVALAERTGCCVELLGRTPMPVDAEPAEIAACPDRRALRDHLVRNDAVGDLRSIEAEVERLLAARQVRDTMNRLDATSSGVRYHAVDVRDADDVARIVAGVYERHGRLDAIVHAAGIGVSKLIDDKTPDDFAAHYDTKVAGLRALLRAARPDLGLLVVYGSLVGPMGNRGQVDYATANDALSSTLVANRFRALRSLVVHWGPWSPDVGMVSEEVARLMEAGGFGPLDASDALDVLFEALAARDVPQVAIARVAPAAFGIDSEPVAWPTEPVIEHRRMSIDDLPETLDHCLVRQRDGAPLAERLPAVAMTRQVELLAEIASSYDRSREVVAVRQMRNFRWLDLARPVDVDVSIVAVSDDMLRVSLGAHSKALVELGRRERPPGRAMGGRPGARPSRFSPDELFDEHLMFHGPRFRGITDLGPVDDAGIRLRLVHLPTPGATLDNVGKAVGLWAMEIRGPGDKALPVGVDEIVFWGADPVAGDHLDLDVEITRSATNEVRADAWVCRSDGSVWCEVRGWRALVMRLNDRDERHHRWPERTVVLDRGPEGLHYYVDSSSSSMARDFVVRRVFNERLLHRYASLSPIEARAFVAEWTAALGAVRDALVDGGLEVFPNEVQAELIRPGLLLVTCDLVPGTEWEVAISSYQQVGVAVVAERTEPGRAREDAPMVAVRRCGEADDPEMVAAELEQHMRSVVGGARVRTVIETGIHGCPSCLAIAFTPTGWGDERSDLRHEELVVAD